MWHCGGMVPVIWRGPGSVQIGLGGKGRVLTGLSETEVELLLQATPPSRAELRRARVDLQRWDQLMAWRRQDDPPRVRALPPLRPLDSSELTLAVIARAEEARGQSAPEGHPIFVLTDAWVTDPIRVRSLVANDVPHLPLTEDDLGITVGPLVVPGVTACTRCLDLFRTDRDERWPVAATQLRISKGPELFPALREAAAGLAMFAVVPRSPGWRVEPGLVGEVRNVPHPECGCIRLPSAGGHARA